MIWFVLAMTLPFILIISFLLWYVVRKTPLQRAQILFRQIQEYAKYSQDEGCRARVTVSLPILVDAVRGEDYVYLRIFFNRLKKDYPK